MAKELTKNHPRVLGGAGTPDRSYLIYDAGSNKYIPTTSNVSPHTLLGNQHLDTDTSVTPSYGDSIYYNGTEWTTGSFGNWGADMEYVGITSNSVKPTTTGTVALDYDQTNALSSSSLGMYSGTPNGNGTSAVVGTVAWDISALGGSGLVTDNIRGIYIQNESSMINHIAQLWVYYPDGTPRKIFGRNPVTSSLHAEDASHDVILIPINEGQTTLKFQWDTQTAGTLNEWIKFKIIGAQCTKRVALSPEVDIIQIVGSQASNQRAQGYVDANTNSFYSNDIWTSKTPNTLPAGNLSGVFPI